MRWSRLWLMLGCLIVWGTGPALPHIDPASASKTSAHASTDVSATHGKVAEFDDTVVDHGAASMERLHPLDDGYIAPDPAHASARAGMPLALGAALPITRCALGPPLAGFVELLI